MIVLRPPGRGNWGTLRVEVTGQRAQPLLQRPGDRVVLFGRTWRVVKVQP